MLISSASSSFGHLRFIEPKSQRSVPESAASLFQGRVSHGSHASESLLFSSTAPCPFRPVGPSYAFSCRDCLSHSPLQAPAPLLALASIISALGHSSSLLVACLPSSILVSLCCQCLFKTSVCLPKFWCFPFHQNEVQNPDSSVWHLECSALDPSLSLVTFPFPLPLPPLP